MNLSLRTCLLGVALALTLARVSFAANEKSYPDPARFEKAIQAFEAADAKKMPAPGGIVCVGSSSMAMWNSTIAKDLAPLPVIPRGFGGSTTNDALFYVDRVITKYHPRAVVIYEGDNDIGTGIAPERIRDTYVALVAAIARKAPEARIYVMSIKPSVARWNLWPKASEANKLLKAMCEKDTKRLTYVSIVEGMLGADGKVRSDIFKLDRLHMNGEGYKIWATVLRGMLLTKEVATRE